MATGNTSIAINHCGSISWWEIESGIVISIQLSVEVLRYCDHFVTTAVSAIAEQAMVYMQPV